MNTQSIQSRSLKLLYTRTAIAAYLFVISALLFVPFARLGVDAHHDGIMYTAANAVSRGFSVQQEVYAQYGPVSAWLQAIEIQIFGNSLLVIRVASALTLAFAVSLIALATQRLTSLNHVLLGVLIWITCAPFFDSDLPMFPWSSDYYLALSGLVLVVASSQKLTQSIRLQISRDLMVGFLLAIGIYLRLNPALPVLILSIAGAFMYLDRKTGLRLIAGVLLGLSSVALVLGINGGLVSWWEQSIIFPRKLYIGVLKDSGWDGLRGNLLVNGVPALLAGFFVLCLLNFFAPREEIRLRPASRYGVSIAVLIFSYYLFESDGIVQVLNARLLLWGVVLGGILLIPLFMKKLEGLSNGSVYGYFFLACIGIGSLAQVFPVADRRHLWWATLPGLILLLDLIPRWSRFRIQILAQITVLLVIAVPTASHFQDTIKIERFEITSSSVLNGMLASRDVYASLNSNLQLVNEFESKYGPKSTLNLCSDGLFASVGSKYEYPDPYYVYWSFPKPVWSEATRQEFVRNNKPFIWICAPISDPIETASAYNYRLVERPACLSQVERFNSWPLASWLAVPKDWPILPSELAISRTDVCKGL